MSHYRVYFIGSDGRFKSTVSLQCADDDAAIKQARQLSDDQDVELWQSARKIARFDHAPKMQF
jgi:hypothetical protein